METNRVGENHREGVMAGPPKSWIQALRGALPPPCSWSVVLPTFPTAEAILQDMS